VIARNTAFTYKGRHVDVKEIGRELGVRYVIEGTVRWVGRHVWVNVQLVDAESGGHLWADRFDIDRADLSEAQAEITGRLARGLLISNSPRPLAAGLRWKEWPIPMLRRWSAQTSLSNSPLFATHPARGSALF
jgi:hypothetical protein